MRTLATAVLVAGSLLALPAASPAAISLRAPQRYGVSGSGFSLGIADPGRDGRPDLVAGVASSGTFGAGVRVLSNTGGGQFASTDNQGAAGNAAFGLDTGDFSSDGRDDIVISNGSTGVVLFKTTAGGGLPSAPAAVATGGTTPEAVLATDISGDGKLDVLAANAGSNTVSALTGDGAGALALTGPVHAAGAEPFGLALGDVTGDGRRDVIVADLAESAGTAGVSVLPATGAAPGLLGPAVFTPAGTGIAGVDAADLDGDGHADVAAVDQGDPFSLTPAPPQVVLLRGAASGALTQAAVVDQQTFTPPATLSPEPDLARLADMNGDGRRDLVVAESGFSTEDVAIFPGQGGFAFGDPVRLPAGGATRAKALRIADLNGDGAPDVAFVTLSGDVVVLLAQGAPAAAPGTVDFGGQAVGGASGARTVTVTNTGVAPLAVRGLSIGGAELGDFQVGTSDCVGRTLAAGATCTASVRFLPSAAGGRSGVLEVESDADTSPPQVALTGSGTSAAAGGGTTALRSGIRVVAGQRRATVARTGLRLVVTCSTACSLEGTASRSAAARRATARRPSRTSRFVVAHPRRSHSLRVKLPRAALAGRRPRIAVKVTTYAGTQTQRVATAVTLR